MAFIELQNIAELKEHMRRAESLLLEIARARNRIIQQEKLEFERAILKAYEKLTCPSICRSSKLAQNGRAG